MKTGKQFDDFIQHLLSNPRATKDEDRTGFPTARPLTEGETLILASIGRTIQRMAKHCDISDDAAARLVLESPFVTEGELRRAARTIDGFYEAATTGQLREVDNNE